VKKSLIASANNVTNIIPILVTNYAPNLATFTNSVYWQEIFQGANPTNFWIMPYSFLSNQ